MNTTYCDILRDLHNNRCSSVITVHELTELHIVQDGLDQEETHAPILWRIFYDSLLCKVNQTKRLTRYRINTLTRHPMDINQPAMTTPNYINHLAFMDDTIWIANSKTSAE